MGQLVKWVDSRNKGLQSVNLLGISIDKYFMPSVANVIGTDLSSYKVVSVDQFACNPMHVGRDEKMPVALYMQEDSSIVSPAYFVFEVIDSNEILPEYLMLWFRRKEFDREVWFHTDGSVRGGILWEELCELTVPVPSIAEQQEIVDAYNDIERRIALKRKINDNLEAQAYAIYQDWFIDNGEAHGAVECVLADLINILDYKRIPLSSQERAKRAKVYRYFGAAGLLDYVDEYLFDGIYLLVGEDGSVIDENGYPYLQYVDGKFWVNNHAHILQGVGDATTELLYLILLKTNIKEYVTGAVQAKLNQDNLRAIPAIRISKDDMASFNAIIQPIFAVIRNNNLEIDNLQVLKASILTKLTQAN